MSITYKLYWRTTRIASKVRKAITTMKKRAINISRVLYSKSSTIYLPRNNILCSNKDDALHVTN